MSPAIKPEKIRLGKQEYVHDERTLMLARFLLPDLRFPEFWDFDKSRAPFPLRTWNNTRLGDCVIAGEANQLMRLERVEQRRTISLTDNDAVALYEAESIRQFGHYQDEGLVVVYNLRDWRNVGWTLPAIKGVRQARNYQISAYGELEPNDPRQLRMASYFLQGIQLGFWLPLAAQRMTNEGLWDYQGQSGPEWQPGGWGGHLVYSKAYTPDDLEVLSWGLKIKVTNPFIVKYCDEAWAAVDKLDSWRTQQTINVNALTSRLNEISGKINL